ncbi:MAG: 50S ribosomal protein L24 [Xanthomonadales bacterium]|jgi:large subunit ribosomal protein L24|nr:50S ribosomal protein L24 [Xanthomonadales bacterium]
MKRIRKGDEVIVTTGRSKGQRGHVLRVIGEKLMVENVNMVKKHQKPNPSLNVQGGIIEKESPIHQSNVMLYNPGTGKGDRVSFKTLEDGRKVRIFTSTGEAVDI